MGEMLDAPEAPENLDLNWGDKSDRATQQSEAAFGELEAQGAAARAAQDAEVANGNIPIEVGVSGVEPVEDQDTMLSRLSPKTKLGQAAATAAFAAVAFTPMVGCSPKGSELLSANPITAERVTDGDYEAKFENAPKKDFHVIKSGLPQESKSLAAMLNEQENGEDSDTVTTLDAAFHKTGWPEDAMGNFVKYVKAENPKSFNSDGVLLENTDIEVPLNQE